MIFLLGLFLGTFLGGFIASLCRVAADGPLATAVSEPEPDRVSEQERALMEWMAERN